MKKETALVKKMKAAASQMKFADTEQVKQWEADRKMIAETVDRVKKHIGKQPAEQQLFSFMPYEMTRTSPFFPMNRREMGNRIPEKLEWKTSWGKMTVEGIRLSIHDEGILLVLLTIAAKSKSSTVTTTKHEICKLAGIKMASNTYNSIKKSIKKLAGTLITLETRRGKKELDWITGSIISWARGYEEKGNFEVVLNPYFMEMYAESFVTKIDLKFRQSLKGDMAKALYRFYRSQKGLNYNCYIVTLATAINLNTDLPMKKIRDRVRAALRELKSKGFLSKWSLSQDHIVSVEKAPFKQWRTQILNNGG